MSDDRHYPLTFGNRRNRPQLAILVCVEAGCYASVMGLTHVTTRVLPVTPSKKFFEAEFLVDTGAIDCLAPAAALKRLGIRPEGKDVYELANGDTVEYPYGFARVCFMGSETVTRIIFGPAEAEPILGVVALESTGIGVDPVSKQLRKMAAKPLK